MGQVSDEPTAEEEGANEVQLSFEELGLDPRLVRSLLKKKIEKPTLIQQSAIPYVLVPTSRASAVSCKFNFQGT